MILSGLQCSLGACVRACADSRVCGDTQRAPVILCNSKFIVVVVFVMLEYLRTEKLSKVGRTRANHTKDILSQRRHPTPTNQLVNFNLLLILVLVNFMAKSLAMSPSAWFVFAFMLSWHLVRLLWNFAMNFDIYISDIYMYIVGFDLFLFSLYFSSKVAFIVFVYCCCWLLVEFEVWTARDLIQSSSVCCDFAFIPCFQLSSCLAEFVNASHEIEISTRQMGMFPHLTLNSCFARSSVVWILLVTVVVLQ